MSKDSQAERVLRSFQRAGTRGVCAADWSGVNGTPDGKGPIPRFAARIMELRQDGYRLEGNGEKRHGTKVLVLRPVETPHVRVHGSQLHGEFAKEFEALSLAALAPAPRNAIHDEDAA